jgi:hypothetical protein
MQKVLAEGVSRIQGRPIRCGRARLDLAYPEPVRLLVHMIYNQRR